MKHRIVLEITPAAATDLESLARWLEHRAGIRAARRRIKALVACSRQLLDLPELGRRVRVGEVRARRLVCGSHVVYYVLRSHPAGRAVVVLRYWDTRRDPDSLRL